MSRTPSPSPLPPSHVLLLNTLALPIRLPRINFLTRLLDRRKDSLVGKGLGNDGGGLGIEGDVVGVYAFLDTHIQSAPILSYFLR